MKPSIINPLIFLLLLSANTYAQQYGLKIVAPGATLYEVSSQFSFTEGPAVNKQGDIYFTDQPNNKIWKYDRDGQLSLFMDKAGRSNGLYFDRKGRIISCADEKNELWAIDPASGKPTVLLTGFRGRLFNGPNDLWIDPEGGIYFTDPFYPRDYWTRKEPEMDGQKVFYLPKGKKEPIVVEDSLLQPNGIVGTPDGKQLYVADLKAGKTYRYDIKADGTLSGRQLFAPLGSDGMTLDNEGNVYLTGKGVTVYDRSGTKLGNIPIASGWVGNVCFGGKDRDILFITASKAIYTLQMRVTGVE
jgi:gluconolactonase